MRMKIYIPHIAMSKLLSLAALFIMLPAMLLSCSDEADTDGAYSPGTMVLNLTSRSSADSSTDKDPEYYINEVDIFFFPGGTDSDDEEPAYEIHKKTVGSYNSGSYTEKINSSTISKLFPDSATSCPVYVVANISDKVSDLGSHTMKELKAIALTTDFPNTKSEKTTYAMDGTGSVTIGSNMVLTGSVTLERAIAKIQLVIEIADEVTSGDVKYTPVSTDGAITAEIYNAATNGLLNGFMADEEDKGFTGSDYKYTKKYETTGNTYSKTDDSGNEISYTEYTHDHFYSYQNEWKTNFEDRETSIKLQIPWKKEDENEYITYYYQIPINYNGMQIKRNHFYKIRLKVGMLGSTNKEEAITVDALSYEILDWGSGESDIKTELTKSHYLVVDNNEYTLNDESSVSFGYNTCSKLSDVYLVSASYESTKYTEDDGTARTVYLYKADYSDNDKSYKETSSYGEYDTTVQADYKDVVSYIKDAFTGGTLITNKLDVSSDETSMGSGTITFNADVTKTAGKVYRPITYKIALINDKEHGGLRHTVTITQYPSKYIEYAPGGNIFVNGYFARVAPDAGYSSSDLPEGSFSNVTEDGVKYYRSYGFTVYKYDKSSKYYYSALRDINEENYSSYLFGDDKKSDVVISSYEYLLGNLSNSDVKFIKTVDVHVSSFTKDDNSFTTSQGKQKYIIGDPRVNGGLKCDTKHSTSYSSSNDYLYDYFIYGKTHTSWVYITYYDRYVQSWGSDADSIKVGGTSTDYDNIIAPYFKNQSSFGAALYAVNFKVAQQRCATYQEAGYPAGRWRLPTLAEIAFVIRVQNDGVVDSLFNSSRTYWTSSGGYIKADKDMTYTKSDGSSGEYYVRCVYDLWYWSDEPKKPTHKFYALPYKDD